MSDTTAIVLRTADTTLEPVNIKEAHWLSEQLANGEATGRAKSAGTVLAVLMCGRELGLTTMQSIRGIHLFEGKPQLSSDLMVALVRRSPLCKYFRLIESTDERAVYETQRTDEDKPLQMSFTLADATRANLVKKDNWKMYPRAMLRARCAAELARAKYQEVLFGLYVDGELGEIEVDSRPMGTPTPSGVVVETSVPAARIVDVEVTPLSPHVTTKEVVKDQLSTAARVEPTPLTPQQKTVELDTFGPEPAKPAPVEPQLTTAEVAAGVAAAPVLVEDTNKPLYKSSMSQDELDEVACDSFCTEMMSAPDRAALDAIIKQVAARFPEKTNRFRRRLGDTVWPLAKARIGQLEQKQGEAA